MKAEKRSIITAACAIIAVTIAVVLLFPVIRTGIGSLSARKYFSYDLKNVDGISLIAHCETVDGKDNSVAGVKESVRLGANGVVVDICFRKDGTPVMCGNYSDAENAPELENLLKEMNSKNYSAVSVYLNIIQLSDMAKLNTLASEYPMPDRLFIIGIDEDRYGMITSDDTIIPFFLSYTPTSEEIASIDDGSFTLPDCIGKYSATGLIIKPDDAVEKLIGIYSDYGIPLIVSKASSDSQLCKALHENARTVYVDDIERSVKTLDKWKNEIKSRNEKSVQQSIKALSTKSE